MESVYLETTIISYLVARPSRDLVLAAHQSVTHDWWENQRGKYRCVVSDEVVREVSDGDPAMASLRLSAIDGLPALPFGEDAFCLVDRFMGTMALPTGMRTDAVHLAIAATAKIDYLLTWNCKHLANAHILRRLEKEAARLGMNLPTVCTPLELMEGASDVY